MRAALGLAAVILLALAAPAAGLQGSMYMSITNNTIKCFEITLPDDAGAIMRGETEYELTMDPPPYDTWSDLSQQIIRTDENNTVVVPVCFRSFGREAGDCAKPFSLGISSDKTPVRTSNGGVCVSAYPDIDVGKPLKEGEDPAKANNDNADIFSMAFDKPVLYATPGSEASLKLKIESYASMSMEITMDSDVSVSPLRSSLSFSKSSPKRELEFSITAPQEAGEYGIEATGKMSRCSGNYCTKYATATLVVQDSMPELAGFTLTAFPFSLNVKALEPVEYELTLSNQEESATFLLEASLPEGLESDFQPQEVAVAKGEEKTVSFTITPNKVSYFYELKFTAKRGALSKETAAYLSTNEMLTDALREADEIRSMGGEVDESLEDFFSKYQSKEYGEELEDYGSLKDSLAKAREQAQQPSDGGIVPTPGGPGGQASGGFDLTLIIIIVVIAAGAAIGAFFFLRKRKGGGGEAEVPPLEEY